MKKLFLTLLCFPLLVYSQDDKRLALVIGNANYDKGPLNNPVNDALLMAQTLDSLYFDVILDTNIADKRSFKETIREFGNRRPDYDVAFVYYAGHGIQVGSENYLLPTKEVFESEYDVQDYGVSVQDIMRYLTGMSNHINVLILDACRDNPFERNWNVTRSLKGNGLAKIPPPTGSLIAFSTDAGMTAADGDGKNSIYCKSLSQNLLKEDIGLEQVFKNVRTDVLKMSNNQQSPVESSKLTGTTFYLKKNFSVYNSTIDEILSESDNKLNQKSYYKSIEVLNDAAKVFKKRGDKDSEIICRVKIIDNYFNKFRNSETELHLFPIIHDPSTNLVEIDVNNLFDSKSYNIFFDNLLFFCFSYDDKNQKISNESIYNFLVYVRYVLEIPIQNYGLQLDLSQLNHSVDDYDKLIRNIKQKSNNKNYKYLPITDFWEFKLGYSSLRKHNDLQGPFQYKKLEIINSSNMQTKFFEDFYRFIEECNNSKVQFNNSLEKISFDESYFFEKDIYDYTLKRYTSGLASETDRMIIDLLGIIVTGETSKKLSIYTDKTNLYFNQISSGFNLDSDIIHSSLPWIIWSLDNIVKTELLYNGYNSNEILILKELILKLSNYLEQYRDGLITAKTNNDQETLIKYSDFNRNSDFDISGYYGREIYCFSNINGLEPDYMLTIDSLILKHINSRIKNLSNLKNQLISTDREWVRKSLEPYDYRYNLEVLNISEFSNIANKNIKSEILNLEKSSKLSDIIELDVLPLLELLDQINVKGMSNGEIDEFSFFEWYSYLSQLSEYSRFSEEDHLIILNVINQLRIKFSLSSPNFVWDIKEIIDTYVIILDILSRSENHLVEFSIKKYISGFIDELPRIYLDEKLDSEYSSFVESEINRLKESYFLK